MERNWLICVLMGYISRDDPNIIGADLRIKIDNRLIDSGFTPLDENDLQLMGEVEAELLMSVIGSGHNRKDRRK